MTSELGDREALLGRLREQAHQLVAELPGPLRRIRLCSGEVTVEVEWPDAWGGDLTGHAGADGQASWAGGAHRPGPGADGANGGAGGQTAAAAGGSAFAPVPAGADAIAPAGAARSTAVTPVNAPSGPPPGSRDIVAPIVGTFYRAPEPGAAPFVQVGDLVEAGQVVGIVEAMKLMNQVTADTAGRVAALLAADGEPVQFGQSLVRLTMA